ncbi:3'-5' exoribonuclease YhaM family protein [Candidatus Laterigemmans baculatus]|uniref:3'-5' exoribonuclease YhaM family protein n=1 Tax=Candidatus Laterigemmans baculatus TaxID=2770505 RepID=UPI0013D90DCF|nr:HD domain-containing protein [Candidatus Laterigemmans baculatus]
MTRRYITQFEPQDQLDQTFRAADKQLRANRQGGKYILLKLSDRTGTLTGMFWNADERVFDSFSRGDFVRCKGRTQLFNGGLQMIVSEVTRVDPAEVDPADFDRFDADRAEALVERASELIESMENPFLRQIGQAFLADEAFLERLKQSAAAVNNHHAYPGGLLQHTVDLMELAKLVAGRYPQLDGDQLLLGAFLHDLGKVEELAGGDETSYTDRGQLVGHIVIGVQMLAEKIAEVERSGGEAVPQQLRWKLEHLVLSHHGMLEYGSPKIPLTLEALTLHHLDNLDAKIASATSIIENDVAADGNWTNYNPALGRKLWKPTQPTAES